MFSIYYAGRRDMPETNEDNTRRTAHGHKMCDVRMGLDFAREHGIEIPSYNDFASIDNALTSFGYTYIGTSTLNDPETIFSVYQGEYINNDLAFEMAQDGATHTSMSVGDILVNHQSGRVFFCDRFGFKEI